MRKATFWTALTVLAGLLGGTAAYAHDTGPHKGAIVEWGEEEYHLEVVPDAKTGAVAVYVYGSHTDLGKGKAKAIDAKSLTLSLKGSPAVSVKLAPAPVKEDPAGTASVFAGKHEAFAKPGKLEGTVSGKVGTKPYSGEFKQK